MVQILSSTRSTVNSRAGDATQDGRRRYVKIDAAADYLDCSRRTILQMIADGRLTGYRCGTRLVRIDLNEIDTIMRPYGGAQ